MIEKVITKDNIKDINYNDVVMIFFAESGATGDAGEVDIILKNNKSYKWYTTNYTFGGVTEVIENLSDIVREEQKLFDILPILKKLNFNHSLMRISGWVDNEWWLSDLELGNHLLIRDKNLIIKLADKFSGCSVKEIYNSWRDYIKSELNFEE